MNYIILIIGFILLVKGADIFVEGSSNIAKFFKIPTIVIGLTLVAFGTSAPEAAVSITASLTGATDLSIANIIGSNIINLFLILGLVSLIKDVKAPKDVVNKDYLMSIFAVFIMFFLILISNKFGGGLCLGRIGGFILLILLGLYLFDMIKNIDNNEKVVEKKKFEFKDLFCAILGLCCVIGGGKLTVSSATEIARSLGMSETLIGLTVVAFGTSLPELCTSLIAAKKGENDIALGNVIGSNIFNVLFILGFSSLIKPLTVSVFALIDMMVFILGSIFVLFFIFNDDVIDKKDGIKMLVFYFIYFIYIVLR